MPKLSLLKILCFLILFSIFNGGSLAAQVPDIGADKLYVCVAATDEQGCYGDIYDQRQQIFVNFSAVRSDLRRKIARRRARLSRVCRSDFDRCQRLKNKVRQFKAVRRAARECWNFESATCNDGPPVQSPREALACQVVNDPSGYASLSNHSTTSVSKTRSDLLAAQEFITDKIASGIVCSEAPRSPVVALLYDGEPLCSGAIVAGRFVLTAAHCFEGLSCSKVTVKQSGGQIIGAARCNSHPSYDGSSAANDVAIVELKRSFADTSAVSVHTAPDLRLDETVVLSGFGTNEANDDKLRATLNTISEVTRDSVSTYFRLGDPQSGTTCVGDSGSPLLIYRDFMWKTVGTLSNGGPTNCLLDNSQANDDTSTWSNLTDPSNVSFIKSIIP